MQKLTYDQIDAMSSGEWLNYREDLIEDYYRRGHVLKPNPHCKQCDTINDYVCFDCECAQLEANHA